MKLTAALSSIQTISKSVLRLTEKEITIKAPWGKVAALTWGNPTNPPVFMCHGRMDVASSFRPLAQLLPDSFFYVSIDLPGNGKSDHLPRGIKFFSVDLVPTVLSVKEHFKWDKFMYIGHSLGVVIGKYYDIAYPGDISRMVELDPMPAYFSFGPNAFKDWYHASFGEYYSEDKYNSKYSGEMHTAPKYTYEKAKKMIIEARGLTEEAAEHVTDRSLEAAGDGLYRFTFDQRQKTISLLPFPSRYLQDIYTMSKTPTLAILAKDSIKLGFFKRTPFVMDENAWPNKNFRFKIVDGNHDVHLSNPGCMAEDISEFLLETVKA